MNKYPWWKNVLLMIAFLVMIVYAVPNIFGQKPAIQISSSTPGMALTKDDLTKVASALNTGHYAYNAAVLENKNVIIRFVDTDTQLRAKTDLMKVLGSNYILALNLESATPTWLMKINANPMKLGLDLQGGVHFLLQVDVNSILSRREQGDIRNIGEELRSEKVRYASIMPVRKGSISIRFRSNDHMNQAMKILQRRFTEFDWQSNAKSGIYEIIGAVLPSSLQKITQYTIEQTMMTLRRRVNELGVSEAVVQQQGTDRISVDLPGIQDATQAKEILGKMATLAFHMVDTTHDAADALGGLVPPGDTLYMHHQRPYLLKNQVVLRGDSITNASSSFDSTTGQPVVNIRLGGGGEALFERITSENIGKPMATLYMETKPYTKKVNGKEQIYYKKKTRIINIATIQSALGTQFQITGLSNPQEAKQLGLLLRAGSLPARLAIIEERTVGPSMGQRNIHLGMLSITVGFVFIVLFMLAYYEMFGVTADFGLLVNLVFLTALLSVLGATLTFPGIAGIVLTVGMAVDYNVLIYERIREEIRHGMTPQAAIHTGYDRAFVTIIDANLVSLIVALILFALGSGPVKGFAITLTIGLFTSIISSVAYSRMLVNGIYGGRRVKKLWIGMHGKFDKKEHEV